MALNTNRYSHMVQEYYVQAMRQAEAQRRTLRQRLRTRQDVLKFQKLARAKIRQAFGPLPQKTPLNARVTGTLEQERFRVEKVLFESRPGFIVSANLYVPKGLVGKAPCAVGTCGHSQDAKAYDCYQAFVQGLAAKGFLTLLFDPISQGERVQYPGADGHPSIGLCPEHNMIGFQQSLVGEFFGTWRAWDAIRALDYVLSRPEADAARVGIVGQSGGGTMTTWLCGLEDRFTMAAPSCFVNTLQRNIENELPGDVEQIPPGLVKLGLDQFELLVPFAPRPVILLTKANDFFDQRGAQESYRALAHIYKLLGAEENIKIVTAPGEHGFEQTLREPMYEFFTRHGGLKVSRREGPQRLYTEQELFASAGGTVAAEGSRKVFDFTRDAAAAIEKSRPKVPAAKLPGLLTKLLALPKRTGVVHHRILRSRKDDGGSMYQGYALDTEAGIQAIVTAPTAGAMNYVPREARCTLLVPHLSAHDEITSGVLDKAMLQGHGRLFAVDVRGVGESRSSACNAGSPLAPYGTEYFYNAHGILLGEPYLGRRVHDVLCTIDWLRGHGCRNIHLVGRGMGSVPALLAAAIDRKLAKVTLVNTLMSYFELTQTPMVTWPASCSVIGALKAFDLSDCHQALGKKLRIIQPWNAEMK